jgi:hypothetical protein
MAGMGIAYENTRINFDNIVKRYEEYKALYKLVNNGKLDGLTSFDQFYWRMTYYSRYQDRKNYGTAGY